MIHDQLARLQPDAVVTLIRPDQGLFQFILPLLRQTL